MTEARLILDREDFSRSESGHVHGRLFVQLGDLQFPDAHWNDFIIVVLGWWCRACCRLLTGDEESLEVPFMDGPYCVRLGPIAGQSINMELIEARSNRSVQCQAQVSVDVLIDSVVSAARRAERDCQARGWSSRDGDELEDALKSLQRARLKMRLRIVP
jgi:hypothetical protein